MTHCLIIGGHIGIGFYDDVVVLDTSDIEELPQGPGNVGVVLPHVGRDLPHGGGGVAVRKPERQVGQRQGAVARVLLFQQHAARPNLRVVDHLVDALHLGAGNVDAVQQGQDVGHGTL